MCLPSVSIIIPVYNVEDYVCDCLQSVICQDYEGSIECVLVDDCGKDKSIAIAERIIATYTGKIKFRILHHGCNKGLSEARNTGFDGSTGDFVIFLDSDDKLYPYAISSLVEAQQRMGSVVTMGNWNIIELESGKIISTPGGLYKKEIVFDDLHAMLSLPSIHGVTQNKLISRDFWIKNNLYQTPGLLHEDNIWSYKLLTCITEGNKFCITPAITYVYNMRQGSIMHSFSLKHIKSYIKAVDVVRYIAENAPVENKWFAIKGLETFKRAALINIIQKVKGVDIYKSVYRFIRSHNIVSVREYLKYKEISRANKLFYIHNFLPTSIGALLQYFLIKLQLRRSKSQCVSQKLIIDLSKVDLYN